MKNLIPAAITMLLLASSCSTTSRFAQQRYDDDLYHVSSGAADRQLDEVPSRPSSRGASTYDDYINGRRSTPSNEMREYDPNEEYYEEDQRTYNRNLDRYNDPMWYDPGFDVGLGGFWGSRRYMLFNPWFPPYWSMSPGWSLSLGYGFGNWGVGFGFGSPWGFYDPFFNPFWNPWYSPWNNPWNNPWWGPGWNNGWAGGGDFIPGPSVPRQPVRSSRVGSTSPRTPRSVFTPATRSVATAPANGRMAAPARQQQVGTPGGRPQGTRIQRDVMRDNGTATPARSGQTPTRETTAPSRREAPAYAPPSRSTYDRPSSPSRGSSSTPSWNPPSRSGSTPSGGGGGGRSGGGSTGGSGGGGSRPSGTGGGRPR